MPDRIVKSIELNAPIERVWRALTNHEEFGAWFKVRIDRPFALGAKSTGQTTDPAFEHVPWIAEVVAMDEPRYFAFRWPHMDETEKVREDWAWTVVEFWLEPTSGGTRLTVTESGFDALPAGRRSESYRMNEQGWGKQMGNVKAYVAG
jgi:uncharacterized protein YndB with AHSA1/START domain